MGPAGYIERDLPRSSRERENSETREKTRGCVAINDDEEDDQ